jgi:hypothetical protein
MSFPDEPWHNNATERSKFTDPDTGLSAIPDDHWLQRKGLRVVSIIAARPESRWSVNVLL